MATDIRAISDKIYANKKDKERMKAMNEVYYKIADFVKGNAPGAYEQFVKEAEEVLYSITEPEAAEIVRRMMPYGEHWTTNDIASFIAGMGEMPDIKWYLVMNMMYNDHRATAQKMGMDTADFYYNLAHDFIYDEDAQPHKVERYFK